MSVFVDNSCPGLDLGFGGDCRALLAVVGLSLNPKPAWKERAWQCWEGEGGAHELGWKQPLHKQARAERRGLTRAVCVMWQKGK